MRKYNIKEIILKNKKVIIGVSLIFLLGSRFILIKSRKVNISKENYMDTIAGTVVLEKGDLNNSIIVSGSVKSGEVSNVSTSISAKVKSINVNVGDTVNAGDIICTLDDSDILKQIETKTKSIEEERKALQENYNKLNNQLQLLKSTQAEATKKQNSEIEMAKNNFNNANNDLKNYESTFNSAKNTYNITISGIKSKQDSYENAENNKKKCYEDWIKSGGKVDSTEYSKYIEASENLDRKQQELDEVKVLYDYDNISSKYNEALTIYNEKVIARDTAKSQYDEAVSNSITSANANSTELETLQASINDVSKQIQKLDDNEELKELKENLNKTVLKAETSGKITELKVNVGSVTEGSVATIQSTDNLILEVNIHEYDIEKVTTGMKAQITSDTLTNKVNGELVRISPIADSDEKGGFFAEIAIESGSGLYIGTNAKAEIVISGKSNVILAPIDAIKDIDSNPKVVVQEANGEFKEVEVTIGERNDYYVEVSGQNIKEGIEIKADVGLDDSNSEVISDEESTNDNGDNNYKNVNE